MRIHILFNNESLSRKFSVGWGFSCLVGNHILFDTGENEKYLFRNMKSMNVDISNIETVVISHEHWDHTGGLWGILEQNRGLKVYVCPGFSKEFKKQVENLHGKLIEADKFVEISKNIFITGEMPGTYNGRYMPEQALVVTTENGITAITGCAHPGIIKMIESIKEKFFNKRFYLAFGGFHLTNKDEKAIKTIVERFKQMGIKKAGPAHCSGKAAEQIFNKEYEDNFIAIRTGQVLKV
ncbi:MAG: MBL fold metallo-hydrolase [Candidatus Omnitrophota bacterium]|nr:MBL fold metallo-hydrolase [Candidatus Omnitrophota bacterium]